MRKEERRTLGIGLGIFGVIFISVGILTFTWIIPHYHSTLTPAGIVTAYIYAAMMEISGIACFIALVLIAANKILKRE